MGDQPAERASHLVVVGSSAGGIEALFTVLGSLPASFPAAVVLAQHLDPARPSFLSSILVRKTPLPVVLVEQPTPLENGKVYVVPANQHVVIDDGQVNVEGDHENRPRPSVDLLFSTAARSYGDRVVAVILTGSGSDGAAGAVDVKTAGGTVVIQNPATAAHPSMPLALPPTVVDHVANLDGMGRLLQDLVSEGTLAEADLPGSQVLPELLDLVSRQAAIDFQSYKQSTILRRVGRRMAVNRAANLGEYVEYAKGHREELGELARSFLIKVTEFFRDPEAFEFLRQDVVPRLIEAGRERGRVLRMWSAGCATGEEAYSLAMLVSDLLGPELPSWNVRIFATDLDESAVDFARRGLYPASVLRYVPEEYRERYFDGPAGGCHVEKAVRQLVIFGQQDLARGAPFPRIDLVVCRNLLIYFKPELQQDILDLFAYALHQKAGYLFLGKSETARPARGSFDLVNKKWKIYRCSSGAMAAPVAGRGTGPTGERPRRVLERLGADAPAAAADAAVDVLHLRRLTELVLRYLPAGVVLVDRSYRILSLNATARRLLGVRDVVTEQDFLHTVRSLPYAAVRNAIDRVVREKTTHVVPDLEMEPDPTGAARFVTLHLAPVQSEGAAVETVVLSVVDSTEVVELRRRLAALQAEEKQLADEIHAANARLKRTNEELQEANEVLQGANEELLLAQEELQATNEEFEATNEELQATNEELETNNEELQATNEELQATNEELTARTSELQDMAKVVTGERVRLSELVEVAPYPIMVLSGANLTVEAANARSEALLGGRDAVGRAFEELCTTPQLRELLGGAQRAFRDDESWDSRAGDAEAETFTAMPTHTGDGRLSGVVLYGHGEAAR